MFRLGPLHYSCLLANVSVRNMKSRLYVVIKSLTRSDLFLSEWMFRSAKLTVLLFVPTLVLVWRGIGTRLDRFAVRLFKALDFLSCN